MKIKQNALITWLAAALAIFSLAACDTRPIPGDLILSTYNSEMEATRQFAPMDTLFVKVAGMTANRYYQVSALDADNRTIAVIEAQTDADGIIGPVPLWYDLGLKSGGSLAPPYVETYGDLTPVGFKVNVKSLFDNGTSTDFTQDMFLVYGKSDASTYNPKPVVFACYSPDGGANCYPENAFKETGSKTADDQPDAKTKIYVKADRIPASLNSTPVTAVDFYILPFTGKLFEQGDDLTADAVVSQTDVPVANATAGTLLWDLNVAPTRINPGQDEIAYSIVMDTNQDGVFDVGIDWTEDGVADDYIDGVDGNGIPGFIIQNTPANDMFVTIKDAAGNIVNSIPESGADADQYLTISIDNVPLAVGDTLRIYLLDSFSGTNGDAIPAEDVRSGGLNPDTTASVQNPTPIPDAQLRFLPYIENHALLDTSGAGNFDFNPDPSLLITTPLSNNLSLDLVVDINNNGVFNEGVDYFIEDAVTVLYVPPAPVYTTCSDDNGNNPTVFFDETNSDGNTVVYLKAEATPPSTTYQYDAYVLNQAAFSARQDGVTQLADVAMISRTDMADGDGVNEIWDLNATPQVINPSMANNTYYLVIDDTDGTYENSDTVLTFVILNTNANSYPRVNYVNIASGGSFGNTWAQHWTLYSEYCDYRDNYAASGLDTNPSGSGYGIKAVFNPYFSWFYNPDPQTPVAGLYYGLYVDVYIVNAATFDLADYGHAGELNDTIDVTGRHSTLSIQPSCYNGAGMMNIWPAPMTPGSYHVIVDVNRNGRIDEGVDIIDAVNQADSTIVDDPTVVGFTVD